MDILNDYYPLRPQNQQEDSEEDFEYIKKFMKVLSPGEIGKGILIEYDAGHVSPYDTRNLEVLKEQSEKSPRSQGFVLPIGCRIFLYL